MMQRIRDAQTDAQHSQNQTDNLQTKYENLDSFYVTRREFEDLTERVARNETNMNEKLKELLSEYDSEDESQNN